MAVKHIACGRFANESERRAAAYLSSRLESSSKDQQWFLLTNYSSSSGSRHLSDEIDMVIIGPPGVSAIEIKHWSALDLKRDHRIAEREADKINDKAKRLASTVRKFCTFNAGFIAGKLLLTAGESEKFKDGHSRTRIRGVDVFGLSEWRDLLETYLTPVLSDQEITSICRGLQPNALTSADGSLNIFQDYLELEPVTGLSEPFHRVYRGRRKPGRDRVILHIYDLSATKEKKALDMARREFETLQRLQKSQWLPSLLDSFQPATNYPGEMYFFSYIDTEAASLADRAKDKEWPIASRIETAKRCVVALMDLHKRGIDNEDSAPILHRNLTPESIRIRSNGEPLLTQLHCAKLPDVTTLAGTVWPNFAGLEEFVAPEVLLSGLSACTVASDTYSLCASLRIILKDMGADPLANRVMQILETGLMHEPSERCTLETLSSDIEAVPLQMEELKPVAIEFWDEDTPLRFHNRHYRIVTRLGAGSIGTTFKVMEIDPATGSELSGPYVAKAITNEQVGEAATLAYAKVRAQTGGPHLAGVLEVGQIWRPNEITALLRWIQGEPLSEWIGVLLLYFDELANAPQEEMALTWLNDLCDGLTQLHQAGLVHGDVSPRNIIVDSGNVTLTDFDLAGKTGQIPLGGTSLYCAPEVDARALITLSDDIYALAATLFHVLFDRHPFQYSTGTDKKRGMNWDGLNRTEFRRVAQFMDVATHPDRASRFKSALEAAAFLRNLIFKDTVADETVTIVTEAPGVWTDNEVPWLSLLLQSYPGSPKGNSETRGLDSDFARQTYVETRLDSLLAEDIVNRKVNLVILCGNAGDGKTAFLQNLASKLGLSVGASAQRVWNCSLDDGLNIRANLDGSAAYKGRSANELLNEFFAPFHTQSFPENLVHLVAINDGPLLQWLNDCDDTYLTEQLRTALDEDGLEELDSRIRFIDLNARSLVGGCRSDNLGISTEFLDELLNKLLGNEQNVWKECETCTAQTRCHAWRSVSTLRDERRGHIVRERLTRALRAVHQRGEIHITARGLRAALVYILFGTHDCADLHNDPNLRPEHYYDRAFDSGLENRQGELLAELRWLDPALESHPQIDRHLLRDEPEADSDPQSHLRSLRRRAYFEWPEHKMLEVGGSEGSLDLARGRHLEAFLKVGTGSDEERGAICSDLCEGISRLEDLPKGAFLDRRWVPLKITPRTPTETAIWVNKPRERFSLRARQLRAVDGIETMHTHVILSYQFEAAHKEELVIGAELFHLLMELKEGYQISDAQSDDVFANLTIFKQRLAQEGDRTLFAWNPLDDRVFEVRAEWVDAAQRIAIDDCGLGERE